jgi:hypothetical protein
VTFCNGDEDDQEEIAATGKQALEIARRMLAECALSRRAPRAFNVAQPSIFESMEAKIEGHDEVSLERVRQSDG